ncbi:MAG: DUF2071 domain-containing protein [Pirellulales bacterium]
MRLPTLRGTIDRRLLVNFRVDPQILAAVLPAPFRPQLANGWGMAGICLIRLRHIRPRLWPASLGISSENAAHRVAVEWYEAGRTRSGVFIPRRDTSSRLNAWAGGRLFPGEHGWARFDVREDVNRFHVALDSEDGRTHVLVDGSVAQQLPKSSVFSTLEAASEFFRQGALGYSATRQPGVYDGLELHCQTWRVEPLGVDRVESSYFEDRRLFPEGAATFDCALLMRGIPHQWRSQPSLHNAETSCLPA